MRDKLLGWGDVKKIKMKEKERNQRNMNTEENEWKIDIRKNEI